MAWSPRASRWRRRRAFRSCATAGTPSTPRSRRAAMLGLTEPESAGIGGDMEAIYYSAKDHRLYGLNAAGWAPASHTVGLLPQARPELGAVLRRVQRHRARHGGRLEPAAQQRFGRMSLAQVLQPSIEAARQGFGLTERIRGDWESYDGFYVDMLQEGPRVEQGVPARRARAGALQHLPKPGPCPGLRAPGQGRARRVLPRPDRSRHRAPHERRRGGVDDERPVVVQVASGCDPISTTYKGYEVYQMPPQTQGFATLEMLNILQECGPAAGL